MNITVISTPLSTHAAQGTAVLEVLQAGANLPCLAPCHMPCHAYPPVCTIPVSVQAAQEAALLEVRKKELGELGKAIPMRVGMQSMLFAAPTLAMVVCFAVFGTGVGWASEPLWVLQVVSPCLLLLAALRSPG